MLITLVFDLHLASKVSYSKCVYIFFSARNQPILSRLAKPSVTPKNPKVGEKLGSSVMRPLLPERGRPPGEQRNETRQRENSITPHDLLAPTHTLLLSSISSRQLRSAAFFLSQLRTT